jgi:hypothetical protein
MADMAVMQKTPMKESAAISERIEAMAFNPMKESAATSERKEAMAVMQKNPMKEAVAAVVKESIVPEFRKSAAISKRKETKDAIFNKKAAYTQGKQLRLMENTAIQGDVMIKSQEMTAKGTEDIVKQHKKTRRWMIFGRLMQLTATVASTLTKMATGLAGGIAGAIAGTQLAKGLANLNKFKFGKGGLGVSFLSVGAAAALGVFVGKFINENLLSDETKNSIGKAIASIINPEAVNAEVKAKQQERRSNKEMEALNALNENPNRTYEQVFGSVVTQKVVSGPPAGGGTRNKADPDKVHQREFYESRRNKYLAKTAGDYLNTGLPEQALGSKQSPEWVQSNVPGINATPQKSGGEGFRSGNKETEKKLDTVNSNLKFIADILGRDDNGMSSFDPNTNLGTMGY